MRSLMGHSDQVLGVASSPDRTVLASGSKHNTARLCRVSDGALPRILEGHTSGINSVAFSLDGASLASGSEAGRLLLWDVEQWVES
jgi:WD40 repeat protein